MTESNLMNKIVSLSKRRGFVFQSSEIYGGLKSAYDFGPLGIALKRNIADAWWRMNVTTREDIYGLDSSIMMHSKVWETSGHASGFADPLVDCRNCKERFRADKAPRAEPGTKVQYPKGGKAKGQLISGIVEARGYVCPQCSSPDLSGERQFNLMFQTPFGPVDPLSEVFNDLEKTGEIPSLPELRKVISERLRQAGVYLRPETAQGTFVQFLNVCQSMSAKVPFGIAQIGKSFRNEIITEHFIFRSCEFEQMEIEFFVEPGTQKKWLDYWCQNRLDWYRLFANDPEAFRLREHEKDELAHYSDACFDIEYQFPWGWDELEGVASRTDFDLSRHAAASGVKLSYFDQQGINPETGKPGWRYVPYVIEPAAGLTRSFLALLCDSYREVEEEGKTRVFLKLHPSLAPIKAAVLPLVKNEDLVRCSLDLTAKLRSYGLAVTCDQNQSIGKRYARHDEVGTPFCITVDDEGLKNATVTLRDRDSTKQTRLGFDEAVDYVHKACKVIS